MLTEKNILLTLTYLVGLGELALAVFFWVTNSKNEIRRVMSLFAFSTGSWCVFSAMSSYTSENTLTFFYTNLSYGFAVLALASLVHVVLIYPYPLYKLDF